MPGRQFSFESNKPYHILVRAVDGRQIFNDETDNYRFIFQMHAANIGKPALNLRRQDIAAAGKAILSGGEVPGGLIVREHEPLVSILSFALAENHHHMILVQNQEKSIPLYMQKLNTGFAKYYNLKYQRRGALFETRYKAVPVETGLQLEAVRRYISVINPLDNLQPEWRQDGFANWEEGMELLKQYEFSSFPEMLDLRSSKLMPQKEVLAAYFEGAAENYQEYKEFAKEYLQQNPGSFYNIFLE